MLGKRSRGRQRKNGGRI